MSATTVSASRLICNRRVVHAASLLTAGALAVKLFALAKEIAVAHSFGRSDALESFLTAALIPGLLINLVAESLNQSLVPAFVRVREYEGREPAQRLLSAALSWTIILLLATSILMGVCARLYFPLLGSNFSPSKLGLAVRLFYGLLPVVVLSGVASNFTAILNTDGRFAWPALAPVVTPLSIIVMVQLLGSSLGIWTLVYGTLAGACIHTFWMARMLIANGYRVALRWYPVNDTLRGLGGQYLAVLLSGLVASGGLLVDQSMAAMLPAGSVSALAYAGRFVSVALTVLGGTVSSVTGPAFSEMTSRGEWGACRKALSTWALVSAGIGTVISVGLIVAARVLVRVTLEHGAFRPQDATAVSSVLSMYALQIPFFVSSRVFYRFLLAMRRADLIFYCGSLNLGLDVVFNLVLMRWMGVAGIALATSLWTVSTFVFLLYWSRRVFPDENDGLPNLRG